MPGKPTSFAMMGRLSRAKSHEFSLVSSFKLSYRNREDITNLPPSVLIVGSQNVFTNVSDRVQIRQGYRLDGATSAVISPISASFDWQTTNNGERNVRAGFLTSAANDGKLQYRYIDANGVVSWIDLMTSLTSVAFNFTTFWSVAESIREMLFVDGSPNIYMWSGAITTFASATANTVTKQGTGTWATSGFLTTGTRTIVIGGVSATYSGGEGTTVLTGVSVDFSASAVGSVIHQGVRTTANTAMTAAMSATFANGLIAVLNNQIFIGSLISAVLWISKVDDYTDYTFSAARTIGQGAKLNLDANIVAFKPQENYMYVSAGYDLWYNVSFSLQTSTVGVTYESVGVLPLKTGKRQGAMSQAFVSHMKNNIIMVSNEPTIDMFGRIENYFGTPQTKNISDTIKLDIDSYNFTGGSIFYFKYYIYVAVPVEGLVLVYNIETASWESPQTLPISRFYIVAGELYGHSYNTSESYKLFTGYADRVYPGFAGYPISAIATFAYQNYGSRFTLKKANKLYAEGYINANTLLTITITYELDGCATTKTITIDGSDGQIVCLPPGIIGSLGKTSLGKQKLGGAGAFSLTNLPPKFRAIPTFNNTDFYECSISFSTLGIDQRYELLAFGLNAGSSPQEPVAITQ